MKNIAIIPARSGSKGLPDKNIKMLNGKPLLAYSIDAAIEAGLFDEVMVSTDSKKYAAIAAQWGANVPFLRSEKNSSDNAGSWDTVIEVLTEYRKLGRRFDTVCLLQPTSPLRTSEDICNAYQDFWTSGVDSLTTVCEVDHSPLWTMTLDKSRSLNEFRKQSEDAPRQKLRKYYRINGAIYIRKTEYADDGISLLNDNEIAYIMEKNRSIDIDDELDFAICEFLIHRRNTPKSRSPGGRIGRISAPISSILRRCGG